MPRIWFKLSPRVTRLVLWLGGAALALGAFIKITDEVFEPSALQAIDERILVETARLRVGWLNAAVVDLTALGSTTVVALHTTLTFIILLMLRDRLAALQLAAASAGAGGLSTVLKHFLERARPTAVPRLVEVTGFSYPSGHSLAAAAMYLTIGCLACRHVPTFRGRLLVLTLAACVIGLVASSRVYLGVHYPSDIASGVLLGVAWALILEGLFSLIEGERAPRPLSPEGTLG